MRIVDNGNLSGINTTQSGRTAETGAIERSRSSETARTGGAAEDRVQLSGLTGRISQSMEIDAANRASRVNQLRDAVQSGTYQVDANALGSAMVNESRAAGAAGE